MGTGTLNGGIWEGGVWGKSNFLCSEYNGRADLTTNETDSRERDHSYYTKNVTAYGKYFG